MKKRALMALPKLTATDEMKQIAASDVLMADLMENTDSIQSPALAAAA